MEQVVEGIQVMNISTGSDDSKALWVWVKKQSEREGEEACLLCPAGKYPAGKYKEK